MTAPAGDGQRMNLTPGLDLRRPEYRREVFIRFYLFHTRHGIHPGAVYYLLPHLRRVLGWDAEQALWFAFLNGNTQHPVTSLLLHGQCPDPASQLALEGMTRFWVANRGRLAFDTDRRHWKTHLLAAVASYQAALGRFGGSQQAMWAAAAETGFTGVWAQARQLHSFGRLSAFSYTEYLRIMGVPFDCDDLFLTDRDGSRSHRNGLALVAGLDQYDWHPSNPGFDGHYPPALIADLTHLAGGLLDEARARAAGQPWARWVSLFTLESALCTYKSWHRPNRRYPNVYNDMLYDRLKATEARWPDTDVTGLFWQARAATQPPYLLLEATPDDPGCVPVKQNHYRTTGHTVVMGREDPALWSEFDANVDAGAYGVRRDTLAGAR